MKPRTGVLLINVGTPDSTSVGDVRKYLREFLGDGRVIDLPWAARKLLVNGIIAPFRAPKSAKAYRKLWTPAGSPLIVHGEALARALQARLGDDHLVLLAMRYQSPSLSGAIDRLMKERVKEIVIVPMFPQYSSAATGTALQEAFRIIGGYAEVPAVRTVPAFHDDPGFLDAFARRIHSCAPSTYDHVLFSFHGLPDRHVQRAHTACAKSLDTRLDKSPVTGCACERGPYDAFPTCYKMQCHATARALAARVGLPSGQWSVGFQSRLDQRWLRPFSDAIVKEAPAKGIKRMLVVSPAFVADCLETVIEIGEEYAELFQEHGGDQLTLVPSLNAEPAWVEAFARIIQR